MDNVPGCQYTESMSDAIEPEVVPAEPQEQPQKRKPGRPKGAKEAREKTEERRIREILNLKHKGVSVPAISAATGVSERTVQRTCAKFAEVFEELANVPDFQSNKADIYDATLLRFLKSAVTPQKLRKASVNNLMYSARQAFDMGRLERGQSTANIEQVFVKLKR